MRARVNSALGLMSRPRSVTLAYQISPLLEGLDWAIGGSTLLHHIGIEPNPSDLDLVVQEEHFVSAVERLTATLGTGTRPLDPNYLSKHFARFRSNDGTFVDLMAGIASRTPNGIVTWNFLPSRILLREGLPWMLAEDWLELYALFNRPRRVEQLKAYLASSGPRGET